MKFLLSPGALATLATAASLLAACSWSVPADPGENARLRDSTFGQGAPSAPSPNAAAPASASTDPAAGELYARRCAQCHALVAPNAFRAQEWPTYVNRYGPRAGLVGADRARVLTWLQAHAR